MDSGYWVNTDRKTTLEGLYGAGDVVGGSPKKYVTGCFAEGEIAATDALRYIEDRENEKVHELEIQRKLNEINEFFQNKWFNIKNKINFSVKPYFHINYCKS